MPVGLMTDPLSEPVLQVWRRLHWAWATSVHALSAVTLLSLLPQPTPAASRASVANFLPKRGALAMSFSRCLVLITVFS